MSQDEFEAFIAGHGPMADGLRRLPRVAAPPSLDDWLSLRLNAVPDLGELRYSAPPGLAARVLARAAELEATQAPTRPERVAEFEPSPATPPKYHVLGRPSRYRRSPPGWAYGLAASVLVAVVGVQLTLQTQPITRPSASVAEASADARVVPIEIIPHQPSKRAEAGSASAAKRPGLALDQRRMSLGAIESSESSAAPPLDEPASTGKASVGPAGLGDALSLAEALPRPLAAPLPAAPPPPIQQETETSSSAVVNEAPRASPPQAASAERAQSSDAQWQPKDEALALDDKQDDGRSDLAIPGTPQLAAPEPRSEAAWLGPLQRCPPDAALPAKLEESVSIPPLSNTQGGVEEGYVKRSVTAASTWLLTPARSGEVAICLLDTPGQLERAWTGSEAVRVRWRETALGIELQAMEP